ncbi:hypothetical protein [Jannaschia sp. M317]|uniref:hypothetical protein n=1 Tax=Jannaschia sp. M317 TaxID=2867011 RepID=UPI0021A282ED|nr:hypothetical protein [Jannaschia sp. M317]UWQ18273.1 hypothetical protein K3551_02910 [Jannaschia sp. M317]
MFLAPIKPILAAVLSLALALPLTTTPANAELSGREAAQLLGGLASIYILKEALDDRRDRRQVQHAPRRTDPLHRHRDGTRHSHGGPASHRHDRGYDRGQAHDRGQRRLHRTVPDTCLARFETRNGPIRAFGQRCLSRHTIQPHTLPAQCLREVRTDRGWRKIYRPRCLNRHGWTIRAARH